MSSEKTMCDVGNGFILCESFHIARLPEDPQEPPSWYQVDVTARVRPVLEIPAQEGEANHAAILRPCRFEETSGQSDTSDGIQ